MLTIIAVVAALVVALPALVLLRAARTPDTFRVHRSTRIEARAEDIFPYLDDFLAWSAWSPYEKLDPAMKRRHAGALSGVGAVYEWESRGRAGTGRMEITGARSPVQLVLRLDIRAPFETHNTVVFTLEPRGAATQVTWAMEGPNSFAAKVVQALVDMDRVVGRDFEAGLASLKTVVERSVGQALAAVA